MSTHLSHDVVEQLQLVLDAMDTGGKLTIERTGTGWRVTSLLGSEERVGQGASFGEALENEREGEAGI